VDLKIERLRAWVEAYPDERPPEPPLAHGFEAANEAKNTAERLQEEATARLAEARELALSTAARAEELKAEMAETVLQVRVAGEADTRARAELEGARGRAPDAAIAETAARAEEELKDAEAAHAAERGAATRERHTAELGRSLELDAGYLSRLLASLRRRGVLRAKRSAADARASVLSLSTISPPSACAARRAAILVVMPEAV